MTQDYSHLTPEIITQVIGDLLYKKEELRVKRKLQKEENIAKRRHLLPSSKKKKK